MSKVISNLSRKQILAVYAALIVLTLAAFWQVKDNEFLNFDDDVYVTENLHVQAGLTPAGIAWAFTTLDAEFWHPLTWLSLMLDAQIYGPSPSGFHMSNLIWHILTTLLLFWLLHRMTGAVWPSAFVAALFGVHPLHVESVAWIAERKDMVSGFFWMMTLCLYVYYTEKPDIKRYLLVMLSFACGLMSKSIVVTLPVILILLDYWPLGRLKRKMNAVSAPPAKTPVSAQTEKNRKAAKSKIIDPLAVPAMPDDTAQPSLWFIPIWQIKEKAPFFILSFVFVGLTIYAQDVLKLESWPLWSRIANAFVSYLTYVAHIFYPLGLAVFYPYVISLPVWKIVLCVLLFFSISAAVIATARRFPQLVVGWCWYVIALLPVIGIIQVGKHSWADRYSYLSSIGITIMLAWGVPLLFKDKSWRKKILMPVGIVFVLIMVLLTWRQVGFWQNSIMLYERALKVTENNALAHYNLASTYVDYGRTQDAKPHFREAIRIRPNAYEPRVNLGVALATEGNYEEAIKLYKEAIEIYPQDEVTYCNLGAAYSDTGRDKEAAEQFFKAMELNPDYSEAYFNYANLLKKQGKIAEAVTQYRRAIELNFGHVEAHQALGEILTNQNQSAEAIVHYLEVVKAKPTEFRVLNNLAVNMDKQGRYVEAIDYYRRALDIQPNNPGVHYNLAVALLRTGDAGAGRFHFSRALEVKPDFVLAREALKAMQEMEQRQKR